MAAVLHPRGRPERSLATLAAAFLLAYALVTTWVIAGDRRPLPDFKAELEDNGSLVVEGAVAEPTLREELLSQLADKGDFGVIISAVRVDADATQIDSVGDVVDGLLSQLRTDEP